MNKPKKPRCPSRWKAGTDDGTPRPCNKLAVRRVDLGGTMFCWYCEAHAQDRARAMIESKKREAIQHTDMVDACHEVALTIDLAIDMERSWQNIDDCGDKVVEICRAYLALAFPSRRKS